MRRRRGAFEGLRWHVAAAGPADPWPQVDTTALPDGGSSIPAARSGT